MRVLAIASLGSLAFAGITIINESINECWFNEGATFLGHCSDLYYWHCDLYSVHQDRSCVVRTFSDSMIKSAFIDNVNAAYWVYAKKTSWMVATEESNSSNFDNFKANLVDPVTNFAEQAATKFQSSEDDELHYRWGGWVDPFEDECYQLNSSAIKYDLDTPSKLNMIPGMCGFKINLTNNSITADLQVQILRDGAQALAATALAVATLATIF